MQYYGQSTVPEDKIAEAVFGGFDAIGKRQGWYCEVGAFDGVALSNTYLFYGRWNGINFEAHPQNYAQLCKAQPGAINLCCAAGERCADSVSLWTYEPKPIVTAVSPPEWYVKSEAGGWQNMSQIEVPMMTLTAAFTMHGIKEIDLLSVDTDGSELQVLAGLDFSRWQPRLFIVEYNHALDDMKRLFFERGYQLAHDNGLNGFWTRTQADFDAVRAAVR